MSFSFVCKKICHKSLTDIKMSSRQQLTGKAQKIVR